MRRNGLALIKRGDVILILAIVVLAAGAMLFARLGRQEGRSILVTIDGREYGRWPLDEDQMINITENGFHNRVEIRQGKAFMAQADCPDKICVRHKPICYAGESVICLPHKLVVMVEEGNDGGEKNPVDAISR